MRPERSDWKGFESISVIPSFLLLDYGTLPWSWFSGKDFQKASDLFGLGAPFSTDPWLVEEEAFVFVSKSNSHIPFCCLKIVCTCLHSSLCWYRICCTYCWESVSIYRSPLSWIQETTGISDFCTNKLCRFKVPAFQVDRYTPKLRVIETRHFFTDFCEFYTPED